uniref:Uncharacterized protein n=1 Tax=Rhizophora mucronata TaxID=61149 RepID=A0A2P2NL86_RHIMU
MVFLITMHCSFILLCWRN